MKNKKLLVIIGIALILAVIITVVVVKSNKSKMLNVKRDESVDIGPIKDNFNNNINDLKDAIK